MLGEKDKSKLNEPQFDMQLKVISNIPNASFTIQKTIKLNRGERYIDALELLTNQIIVDGSVLDFAKITNESSDLALAKLELKKGDLTIKKSIKPFFINNNPTPPNPLYVLFPKNDAPLSSKVTYYKKEGKTKSVIDKEAIELGENVLIAPDWIDETE
jgi:hypothetical protein